MEKEMKEKRRGEFQVDKEKWVHDSSLDYQGKPPLRTSTGVWKASLFIIAIEFSERLSYFGIATNLITYLTKILHQDLKTAAKNVNYWTGVTTTMPLIGGFLADAYLGRFSAVLVSSIIYLLGLVLLTMSQFIPSLKPCRGECLKPLKIHEAIFFAAIYLISVGTGGHKPSLESFGADQFDDDHCEERKKKMSYFNWWNSALCAGLMLGVTVVVYVQDNVSWGIAHVILTAVMAISIAIFLLGRTVYRYRTPEGSPLTPMLQVLVAAISKRNVPFPSNPTQLYEIPKSQTGNKRLLCHTNKLRFLDKAAVSEMDLMDIETQSTNKRNPWRLATVTNVEELKLLLNMVPIWLTTIPFGMCIAQTSTFFIKQGSTMDRKVAGDFVLPPATVYSLAAIAMIATVCVYDRVLVPILRQATGNERGISILQRIGIGMAITTVGMVFAAIIEHKRLGLAKMEEGPTGAVPMSVFWLAPQFMILGIGDGFALVGLQEYFYDQGPDTMRSLGIAFYLSVIGAANFLSSLLITVVDHATEKKGSSGWFAKDLNRSRLDLFYWLLAAISAANLVMYAYCANGYSYKNVDKRVADADGYKGEVVGPTS